MIWGYHYFRKPPYMLNMGSPWTSLYFPFFSWFTSHGMLVRLKSWSQFRLSNMVATSNWKQKSMSFRKAFVCKEIGIDALSRGFLCMFLFGFLFQNPSQAFSILQVNVGIHRWMMMNMKKTYLHNIYIYIHSVLVYLWTPGKKIHWQLLEGPIRLDILQFSGHDSKWCDMYSLLVAAGKVSQRGLSEQGTTNGGYEQEGSIDTYQTWWFPSLRMIEIINTIHIGPHEDYWYFFNILTLFTMFDHCPDCR